MRARVRVASALQLALALVLGVVATSQAANVEALRRRWVDMVEADAAVLAPKRFEDARRAMDAVESAVKREETRLLESRAETAAERLDTLEERVKLARSLWREALEVRARARDANAPTLAPKPWGVAENTLLAAARKLEVGRDESAGRQAESLGELFEAARVQAVQVALLGQARLELEEAEKNEATRYAPRSYVRAIDAVERVEKMLATHDAQDPDVQLAASRAAAEAKHATYLLEHLKATCNETSRTRLESEIVDWEDAFRVIARTLGVEPDYSTGMRQPLQDTQVAADQMLRERNSLRAQLAHRDAQYDSLQGVIRTLRQDVRSAQGQVAELRPYLLEARVVQEIQARFTASEGRVLIDNRDVILRLHGLRFASGESELRPENTPILDKIVETLRDLPEAYLIIEGHTDSQGSTSANMELSQRRAEAVRSYLVKAIDLDASRITTVGRGSTRPVASNDTDEGRALNRRIEIVLSRSG
jgi:outer membrane protein OmpA-like peptidoglycan-associated protein